LIHQVQARRHVILCQFVAATGAVLVSSAHGAEAVAAVCREPIVALRAEVEVALHVRAAGRAAGDVGLAQKEVKHGANACRHNQANEYPEACAHGTAWRILADIPDHEDVERGQQTPGKVEVDAQTDSGGLMVALAGRNHPEVILNDHKRNDGGHNRPHRNDAFVVVNRNGLWFAHKNFRPGQLPEANLSLLPAYVDGTEGLEVAPDSRYMRTPLRLFKSQILWLLRYFSLDQGSLRWIRHLLCGIPSWNAAIFQHFAKRAERQIARKVARCKSIEC